MAKPRYKSTNFFFRRKIVCFFSVRRIFPSKLQLRSFQMYSKKDNCKNQSRRIDTQALQQTNYARMYILSSSVLFLTHLQHKKCVNCFSRIAGENRNDGYKTGSVQSTRNQSDIWLLWMMLKVTSVFVLLAQAIQAQQSNYCAISPQHTLCQYQVRSLFLAQKKLQERYFLLF